MTAKKWSQIININSSCLSVIENNRLNKDVFEKLNNLFWNNTEDFNKILESGDFSHSQILSLFFYLAYEHREKVLRKDIYDQTLKDLIIWSEECYKHHGYYGLSEMLYIWVGMLVKGEVVRLGRLEFEKGIMPEKAEYNGETIEKNTPVIHVHIPAGEPLIYEECRKSYEKCLEYFGLKKTVFLCDSWLLSPVLPEILPENSNIIRFQKDFYVYKTDMLGRMFEERVFDWCIYDNPMLYKAKTFLQKNAKEYLRQGNSLPGAWGFFIYEI